MRGDTHAPGGRICRVPVAKVPSADTRPQCVLARVGSAPSYPAEIPGGGLVQVGVGMSKYLGYHLQKFWLGNWVLAPRVLARIVGVYQRRAP